MSDTIRRVAIVGGGFSGAMLAVRLAERGVASTLINRTPDFGLGVAYGTDCDAHLLNVRSARMSAVEDRPDDFVDWLKAHHPDQADPLGFAPRRLYGLYLQDRLAAAHPALIERVIAEAMTVEPDGVRLSNGALESADTIVLATGNPPPSLLGPGPRVIADPWAPSALDAIGADEDVRIVGTGLTMIDMLLALEARGWRGKATAVSRQGLLPLPHGPAPDKAADPDPGLLSGPASARLRTARRQARRDGWRSTMESLRPLTARLWTEAGPNIRRRWLRHLRPWWDIHRHRVAPQIDARVAALIASGRLVVERRRVEPGEADGDVWTLDCTGPRQDPAAAPLTAALLVDGRARWDALDQGLDLDDEGRLIAADGSADGRLFALGPPTSAAYWESTAVPEIRQRIEAMAQLIAETRS